MKLQRWVYFFSVLTGIFFLFSPGALSEEDSPGEGLLNKLLAPGPLMEGHHKLEGSDCLKCHAPRAGVPDTKCLDCHKPIRSQVEKKHGFHGTLTQACIECHVDHKGRDFDSTLVDPKKFDHRLTGFDLEGKHAELKCAECHIEKRSKSGKTVRPRDPRFFGLTTSCKSCHQKDDVHHFPTKSPWGQKDCVACHVPKSWKDSLKFDHAKDAHFPILGKHVGLACVDCHGQKMPLKAGKAISKPTHKGDMTYKWAGLTKQTCATCHMSPHLKTFPKKLLEKKCTDCHTESGWKDVRGDKAFDHAKATRFPLTGKHSEISCKKCHTVGGKEVYKFKSFDQNFCIDCHKNVHAGQFQTPFSGQTCSTCHGTVSFDKRLPFDHRKTDFPLTGKHDDLECGKCHLPTNTKFEGSGHFKSNFRFLGADKKYCETCHKNVHAGQFHATLSDKACVECHNTETFTKRSPFDHETTAFHLLGKHKDLKCSECHVATKEAFPGLPGKMRSQFLFPELAAKNCNACHKDPHEGAFGKKCAECHNPNKWKTGNDFHKNFTLTGVHYGLECVECHRAGKKLAGLSQACITCHQKDDIHNGTQPKCEECHRQHFWSNTDFKHSMTMFPLRGIHRTLDCYSCHSTGVYKGTANQCVDCHRNDALNYAGLPSHVGLVNQNCAECHNQFSFR